MPDTPARPGAPDPPAEREGAPGGDAHDLHTHLGRPRGPDELDPDLLRLRRPRMRIGWLLSLTVIVFCAYVMLELRSDLAFSLEGDEPAAVESAAALLEAEPNSFVEVWAVPDRVYLARVLPRRASEGRRIAPIAGTGGRGWLLLPGGPWSEEPTYREVYRGRLMVLSEMPMAAPLRDWLEARGPLLRLIESAEIRSALEERRDELTAPSGDRIRVASGAEVEIRELVSDQALVRVAPTAEYPDEASWRAALSRHGLLEPGDQPLTGDPDVGWTYEVAIPGGADAAAGRLTSERLFAARVDPVRRTHRAPFEALGATATGLTAGDEEIPWQAIDEILVPGRLSLPGDARILLTTERPGDYWYLPALFGLLGLLTLLFLWGLGREVRALASRGPASGPAKRVSSEGDDR